MGVNLWRSNKILKLFSDVRRKKITLRDLSDDDVIKAYQEYYDKFQHEPTNTQKYYKINLRFLLKFAQKLKKIFSKD